MNVTPLLGVAITLVALVCLSLVGLTVLTRLRRHRRERVLARLAAPHRLLVLEVSAGEDQDDSAFEQLAGLDRRTWTSLRPAVTAMLGKVRGIPAERLVEILRRHGDIDLARRHLTSASPVRRARGAHLLGLARDGASVPALIRLLSDPDPEVPFVVVRSLGHIGDARAAEAVLRAVPGRRARPHRGVGIPAWVAAEALMAMVPQAESVIQHGVIDPDPTIRGVAVTVAGHSIMPATTELLRARLAVEEDPSVRAGIAAALGHVGTAGDVAALVRATAPQESAALRRACATALGELGHPDGADRLAVLLGDQDRRLAQLSAQSLVQLGGVGLDHLRAARAQGEQAAAAARAAWELAGLRSVPGVVAAP